MKDIEIPHEVIARFQPQFPGPLGLLLSAAGHKIFKRNYFGADEALGDIGVDRSGSLPSSDSLSDRPGSVFPPPTVRKQI